MSDQEDIKIVSIDGKEYKETKASCSCCSAKPTKDWRVYKAGISDSDGIYFSYLCGAPDDGLDGCLEWAIDDAKKATGSAKGRQIAASILSDLLGDDEDGIASEMEDLTSEMAASFVEGQNAQEKS